MSEDKRKCADMNPTLVPPIVGAQIQEMDPSVPVKTPVLPAPRSAPIKNERRGGLSRVLGVTLGISSAVAALCGGTSLGVRLAPEIEAMVEDKKVEGEEDTPPQVTVEPADPLPAPAPKRDLKEILFQDHLKAVTLFATPSKREQKAERMQFIVTSALEPFVRPFNVVTSERGEIKGKMRIGIPVDELNEEIPFVMRGGDKDVLYAFVSFYSPSPAWSSITWSIDGVNLGGTTRRDHKGMFYLQDDQEIPSGSVGKTLDVVTFLNGKNVGELHIPIVSRSVPLESNDGKTE